MSSAQSWSVKGIDPKIREAAREAAARQGLTLAEYLNQALNGQPAVSDTPPAAPPALAPRRPARASAILPPDIEDEEDDWHIGGGARSGDPRLTQRIEAIERRTQLAVTGLDRAVSTIDRSVLGLAARIEDAEAISAEAAERINEALEQFRLAGETLSGKLEQAERQASESLQAAEAARGDFTEARTRLEHQVSVAEEVARRAEAAASFLTSEIDKRDADMARTLAEARAVAEEAARQAALASSDAVSELRRLQDQMSARLAESEHSTRKAVESAIQDVRAEASNETRGAREALLEEVVRLENEIAKRVGAVDQVRAEQASLIARIERAELAARESTAGLRQAAGAAIADLRNAQLTLTARVKQVEDSGAGAQSGDLTALRQAQQDIAERLAALETKTESSPVTAALAAFEARLASVESRSDGSEKLDHVSGAVQTLDGALQRLAERLAETESTANTAIRQLEATVSSLGARVEQQAAAQETEAVRAMLEQRLDTMAQSVTQMVGEARAELAGQLQAAIDGVAGEGLEGALADVNRRLAAAERRQAQTIEAISLEIKRMSETVDKRLRAVEARNDDAAASAVREELARMSTTLEQRFDEIERREAAAFDRVGLEVGRLSERLEERVGAVETRSAQAIEHVGEQVARMAERFTQRQEALSRELGERMLDSEERSSARVSDAISSIMQRLAEVETHSAEAIAPVQKAVSSVATKLERYESAHERDEPVAAAPFQTPQRRSEDFKDFSDPEPTPYVSPLDAAQPLRAAPLPPRPVALVETPNDHDIYFAEDVDDELLEAAPAEDEPGHTPEFKSIEVSPDDDLLIDEVNETPAAAAPAPPPIDDDSAFWSPEAHDAAAPLAHAPPEPAFDDFAPEAPLDLPPMDLVAPQEPAPPPGKNDYLANARKAALAHATAKKERPAPERAPRLSLRGSSRIVLWGAAGATLLLMIGGARYLADQQEGQAAAPPAETVPAPAHDLSAPQPPAATDPNAPFPAPPEDPFAAAPLSEGTAEGAPVAHATPGTSPVVAGPLAPRNVSLEQAAQSGDLTAQYDLALQRLAAGRTQDGVQLLRRAADRGFAMAQYRLAKLYERGEGVPADLAVARQWTERAAAAGNRRAMHDLGVYFARGEGAPLDEAAAFRWFRQAAELGVADSQYNLGVLYQQGRGVNASATEALFWFMVAARQGDADAAARATAIEAQLAAPQVDQARARAQAFRPRAASAVANGEFGPRTWAVRAGAGT